MCINQYNNDIMYVYYYLTIVLQGIVMSVIYYRKFL